MNLLQAVGRYCSLAIKYLPFVMHPNSLFQKHRACYSTSSDVTSAWALSNTGKQVSETPSGLSDGIRGIPLGAIRLKHNKYTSSAFPNLIHTVLTATLGCQGFHVSGSLPPVTGP